MGPRRAQWEWRDRMGTSPFPHPAPRPTPECECRAEAKVRVAGSLGKLAGPLGPGGGGGVGEEHPETGRPEEKHRGRHLLSGCWVSSRTGICRPDTEGGVGAAGLLLRRPQPEALWSPLCPLQGQGQFSLQSNSSHLGRHRFF